MKGTATPHSRIGKGWQIAQSVCGRYCADERDGLTIWAA